MSNRSQDWFQQAVRDLEQADDSRRAGRHEWACFAAQQAAEKAVKERYPNSHPAGAPSEHYGPLQSEEAIRYARGDWGVGSDLDLVIVVDRSGQPFERRSVEWDTTELPVPAEVLVYTEAEWQSLDRQKRFYDTLTREVVWVYLMDT